MIKVDENISRQVLLLAFSFILCWTPYAVLAVMAVLDLSQSVTPLLTLLPHQLAKSSVLWNSTILLILNPMVSMTYGTQSFWL